MMKKCKPCFRLFLLFFLLLSLQGCFGVGNPSPFQNKGTGSHGQIGVNSTQQAKFSGKLYFTVNRDLYSLDGNGNFKRLTQGMDVRDPAVSPDGKSIAFVNRFKDYADLMLMPTSGGTPQTLLSGNGEFQDNPASEIGAPKSTYEWFGQPSWSADGQTLLFLSDLKKLSIGPCNVDNFLLDPLILSLPINDPSSGPQQTSVAYSTFGDGGLRDPAYRPGHNDQIIYTSYTYGPNASQIIQIDMEDPNAIANHPGTYQPGLPGCESDPAVPITKPEEQNLEPSFSPDGNTVLYVRREDATHMALYTMPVPEGVTGDPNDPSFNPNAQDNLNKALSPYNQSSKLLEGQYVSQPIWSPDGTHILYVGYANNTFDLWMAAISKNPKTGAYSLKPDSLVQLTNAQGQLDADSRPCWVAS